MTYVRVLLNFQIFYKNVLKIDKMNIAKYVAYKIHGYFNFKLPGG
jgi:hypothetical protein